MNAQNDNLVESVELSHELHRRVSMRLQGAVEASPDNPSPRQFLNFYFEQVDESEDDFVKVPKDVIELIIHRLERHMDGYRYDHTVDQILVLELKRTLLRTKSAA